MSIAEPIEQDIDLDDLSYEELIEERNSITEEIADINVQIKNFCDHWNSGQEVPTKERMAWYYKAKAARRFKGSELQKVNNLLNEMKLRNAGKYNELFVTLSKNHIREDTFAAIHESVIATMEKQD